MTSVTAERGAAFLDERLPGWADMIDLDSFDLENTGGCVIGQIACNLHPRARWPKWQAFDRGKAELGITDKEAHSYGFHGSNKGAVGRTWCKLIHARQSSGDTT